MKLLFFLFLSISITARANVTSSCAEVFESAWADPDSISMSDLIEVLKNNPSISSVEDAISLLPTSMRSNFTFMKKSRSAQGGDEKRPRALLFSPKGGLVVAFNGGADQRGFENIEVYGYNSKTSQNEFRQFSFRKNYL